MVEKYVQGQIWEEEYLDTFNVGRLKKDLTFKFICSEEKEDLRFPLDFHKLVSLGKSKYSNEKVSRALIKSLAEYHNKKIEEIEFLDLVEMYSSIKRIFGEEVSCSNLKKWRKLNGLSFFGLIQYELLGDYFHENFPKKD